VRGGIGLGLILVVLVLIEWGGYLSPLSALFGPDEPEIPSTPDEIVKDGSGVEDGLNTLTEGQNGREVLTKEVLEQKLGSYGQLCAKIAVDSFEPHSRVVSLKGRVESESQKADIRLEVQKLLEGLQVDDGKLEIIPRPLCMVLEVLEPFKNAALKMSLNKNTQEGRPTYSRGDNLVVYLTTQPAVRSYIYIDYFTTNAEVTHMFPEFEGKIAPFPPDTRYTVGERIEFGISPPAGLELITMIASKKQLFQKERPYKEPAEAYLEKLRRALSDEISKSDVEAMLYILINDSQE
jgi:hypothetical protein